MGGPFIGLASSPSSNYPTLVALALLARLTFI